MSQCAVQRLSKSFPRAHRPALADASLSIESAEIIALIGASGSGKSTLLRCIAGLETPDSGSIEIGGTVVSDARHFLPPEHRGVGMVFQDYALFPHLRVDHNIAYGLHRVPAAERGSRVQEVLRLVGLAELQHRFPHELSGGQQQRVALARALAPRPSLLLLDEPFSHLDESLKSQVRSELSQILRSTRTTTLLVTHDTKDALSTADRIAVLSEGSILQCDSPRWLYDHPISAAVAKLFGPANLLPADLVAAHFQGAAMDLWSAWGVPPPPSTGAQLCIRPEHFTLLLPDDPMAKFALKTTVDRVAFCGAYNEVESTLDFQGSPKQSGRLQLQFADEIRMCAGDTLHVAPMQCGWILPSEPSSGLHPKGV